MTVLDASVWVSRLIRADVNHQASREWLELYLDNGGQLVAPAILLTEVAGAIARRSGQPHLGQQAADQLVRMPMLRLVELNRRTALTAAHLAAELQLRGADALYVAVAQRLRLPLITWDREQLDRARRIIEVHRPGETTP